MQTRCRVLICSSHLAEVLLTILCNFWQWIHPRPQRCFCEKEWQAPPEGHGTEDGKTAGKTIISAAALQALHMKADAI